MSTAGRVATFTILVSAWVASAGSGEAAAEVLARVDGEEVSSAQFEAFLEQKLAGRNTSQMSEAEREQFLKAYLVLTDLAAAAREDTESWDQMRHVLLREAMVREIRRAPVDAGASVSDDELRAYYLLHQEEFETEESYVFRHIFFNTAELRLLAEGEMLLEERPLSRDELARAIEEKRERAEEAYERLRTAEDFEVVAKEYSESGGEEHPEQRGMRIAAVAKGDGLYVGERRISPEMREAIRALQPGEFSPVFETEHGYMIVKVERHIPGGVMPFEEVRERIARKVGRDARQMRKEAVDGEILDGFELEESFWVLSLPGASTEEVVFTLTGHGDEREFTVAEYGDFVEMLPPMTRQRLETSPQERAQYLRDYVILDMAAHILAKERGLDKDEALNRRVDADMLERVALQEFDRRVQERVDAMPVEEKDLYEVWSKPASQQAFSIREEVCVEAFAIGSMATEEASPSGQHFGRRYAFRLAERIGKRLAEGDPYQEIAAAYDVAATEEQAAVRTVSLEGGATGIGVTGKPLGAERVRALWDVGWVSENDLLQMGVTSAQAAKAVMRLATGEVTEAPIAYRSGEGSDLPAPDGYLVLRVTGRREPYVRPLSQVRSQVERMLWAGRERTVRAEMYAALLEGVEYELNRPAWAKLWRRMQER